MSHVKSFSAALSVLARHGHIKQRLVESFENHLSDIDEDELPIPMKQPFADLKRLMHSVAPLNGEGPIYASVRKMSVDEADRCAQLMVDLFGAIMQYGDSGQTKLPLDTADQVQVPPFLVKSG